MATVNTVQGDQLVQGNLTVTGSMFPARDRTEMKQEDNAVYAVPLTMFRVWDALATNLPGTAATDDLALVTGTLGTHSPTIQAGDLKAAGATTRYARCQQPLPIEYVAGQTVTLRCKAGMTTTAADTSCTLDAQVYRIARDGTVGSDICATAATTINNTTHADVSFTITPTTLEPGDLLDIRLAIACNDAATGTAVIPTIDAVEILCDVRG
jgi:hypothetical protein